MGKSIVVIPAHNEEKTIGQVVAAARKYADVIVVNDTSTDKTAEVAEKAGAKVLTNAVNAGYTASLNIGVGEAAKTADNIVIMDADGQHDPEQIPEMLRLLDSGSDFVMGVRHQKARFSEKLFGVFAKLMRIGSEDPLCGFRAFKTNVYRAVGHYDSLGSIGTQFVFEARKKGFSITEIDVSIKERQDEPRLFGGRRLKAEWMLFKAFVKVFFYHLFGISLVNPKWNATK